MTVASVSVGIDSVPDASALQIAVIGGGSRGWADKLMRDLALTEVIAGQVTLYDIDEEAAEANAALGNKLIDHPDAVGEWSFEAIGGLDAALDGADVVIISVQDPPAETFAKDLDLPKEYGIYQSVGDTVGPGGTFRAMRAVPKFRRFATAIREQCPDAIVINYTNPMSVCTRTLYAAYPEINAFGVCHGVYHTQEWLAELLGERLEDEPDRSEIDVNVKGINHFTWVDEARYEGRDLFPILDNELSEREPIPSLSPGDLSEEGYWVNEHEITFDLYRRFGELPAVGDRHLAEFVPWYLDSEPAVHRWGIRLTPSEARIDAWPEGDERRREKLEADVETIDLTPSGEEAVEQIGALVGASEARTTNLNLPNQGQAPDLPTGAVVETNATLAAGSIRPVAAGPLDEDLRPIVSTHVANQETLVEAGLSGDLDRAFRAFLRDPLVTIDLEDARALFADLVEAEKAYLQEWNLDSTRVLDEAR